MLKRTLGLLGWLGVILVFIAVALRWLPLGKPEWQAWSTTFALAGLVCTLLYILSQWREVVRSFSGREARYGSLAVASIAVVLAILVGINWLAARRNKRWDLTAAKQFTLSDQTKKILQGLDKPLKMYVFALTDDHERFRARLQEYQYLSKNLQIEYVDPEKRPAVAQKYLPLQQSGTIVIDHNGQIERINSDTEQAITNGLIKVIQGKQNKVYFVQGHDERTVEDSEPRGYSTVGQYLVSDNFATETLMLAQVRAIPEDATVVVIAGPRADFFPNEVELLKGYLARGGKLLVLLDPKERADSPPLTNLLAFLKDWGIETTDQVVINMPGDYSVKEGETLDISQLGALPNTDGTFVLAAKYLQHPMMAGLGRVTVVYRLARPITANTQGSNNRFPQNLVETTATSWGETDLKRLYDSGQVAREPGKGDKDGPLSLGAAVSAPVQDASSPKPGPENPPSDDAPKKESRLAVFGDSDFASNQLLGAGRNADLFLNAVNWLAQQEDMIAIRPRDPEDRRITMTAAQQRFVFWFTIVVLPGLVLASGIRAWWVRR
jgi:ABC-type uncharacterized transport system involved in gliding motility auxiliary subunit